MFDLGFSEMLLVFIVALVVLGPQRMPQLVAKVGRWMGKARSMARQFRDQLEAEVNLEELNGSNSKRTASTPAPPPELSGEPVPPAAEGEPTPPPGEYGGAYPYYSPPVADASPEAVPQPGDDTYSHAHAADAAPMPYYPPEAEGFNDAPLPPLDEPLHPDHGGPELVHQSSLPLEPAEEPQKHS